MYVSGCWRGGNRMFFRGGELIIAPTVQSYCRWVGVSRDAVLFSASRGAAGDLFP